MKNINHLKARNSKYDSLLRKKIFFVSANSFLLLRRFIYRSASKQQKIKDGEDL